jgi:subtilisin family serine protease
MIVKKHSLSKIFRVATLGLAGLVLALGANFSAPAVSQAAPLAAPARYVAKLRSSDLSGLKQYGAAIEQKFGFSPNAAFQNIYSFDSALPLAELRRDLSGSYEYLDLDPLINIRDTTITPDDPGFTLDPKDIDDQWGLPKAGFPKAWSTTTGSRNNVVAVIDTGIDATHRDLRRAKFVSGFDFVSDLAISSKANSDDNGHGTLVAGVIGAVPDNGVGIAGTNWEVTLMPLKALNSKGSGTSSNVSEAIVWAADHGANIINMSLGGMGFGHDTTLSNAITYAYQRNIVIVAAAGNDAAANGGNLDNEPVFPICDDNGQNMIIGVTATDQNDVKPAFANYGKICVDVTAPGKRILSTINHDPLTGASAPNAYAYASGTSLAVPFVTGQAALLRAKNPNATNQQIRDAIIGTADKIDDLNQIQCGGISCNGLLGAGRINVVKSLGGVPSGIFLNEGDVVRAGTTGQYYYISGGKRHLISPFVKEQRFANINPRIVAEADLQNFPEGDYAAPLDGTLVKAEGSAAIYYISRGLRLPITYQIFLLRKFQFSQVRTLSYTEVNSWLTGSFLSPPDGALVRTGKNPTVYWVVGDVLHPISYDFYISRGLQVFPTIYVADDDIKSFSKGDPYLR